MKLSCLQENLNKGLSVVSRLVATRGTLEILSHILLKTEGGRLKLSATNLEIGINYKVGAKIEKEGEVTVPARLFSELVAQLPPGKIDINLKDDTLDVKTGGYSSQVKGLSAEEFPLIPKIKDKKLFSVSAGELKDAINMVSFSAALDETRPVLSGIYVKIGKGKLILASTDSYRLAEKIVELKAKDLKEKDAIVPARSLMELSRILDDPEKEVNVYLDETQIMFETEDLEFTSRLVEGKFPDYTQIIPSSFETKATCALSEFSNIVKVASLFSREAAGSVTLNISSKGRIEAVSAATQMGESNAECDAKVTGKDAEIIFNGKYLVDALNTLPTGDITLEVSGKLNPGVLRKEGDKTYTYVIMPLRV
jgi:DNA polymerase-3 subunit beta